MSNTSFGGHHPVSNHAITDPMLASSCCNCLTSSVVQPNSTESELNDGTRPSLEGRSLAPPPEKGGSKATQLYCCPFRLFRELDRWLHYQRIDNCGLRRGRGLVAGLFMRERVSGPAIPKRRVQGPTTDYWRGRILPCTGMFTSLFSGDHRCTHRLWADRCLPVFVFLH